jgi:hypothetical protein
MPKTRKFHENFRETEFLFFGPKFLTGKKLNIMVDARAVGEN